MFIVMKAYKELQIGLRSVWGIFLLLVCVVFWWNAFAVATACSAGSWLPKASRRITKLN